MGQLCGYVVWVCVILSKNCVQCYECGAGHDGDIVWFCAMAGASITYIISSSMHTCTTSFKESRDLCHGQKLVPQIVSKPFKGRCSLRIHV